MNTSAKYFVNNNANKRKKRNTIKQKLRAKLGQGMFENNITKTLQT